jgi:alpha-galactosidase
MACWLLACSSEDIELAPRVSSPPPADDCSAAVPEGLTSARPPMGWNGYNAFGCTAELNEAKLRANVDALITSGMQSAGYHYVNLDTCWELTRLPDGQRQFDPERLPGGILAFSEDVHAAGLSLGVYSPVVGCMDQPGSEGYEAMDAETYARWGVDYVKSVTCGPSREAPARDLAAALASTGRPIVLSLAGAPFVEWMREVVNVWRTSGDAMPTWSSLLSSIDATVPLAAYARPGAFNDPDMLEIGNGSLTAGEQRVQLSVWSILSAPLLAGNDLSTMTEETRAILTKGSVIALNQDPLGLQAVLIKSEGDIDVLAKPLAECGARGAVLYNRGEVDAEASVTWQELWLENAPAAVLDLWTDTDVPARADGVTVLVPAHDAVALRVSGVEPPRPSGRTYLSDLRWTYATNGFGPVELDTTNGETGALDGAPIRLRGGAYDKGLGVHGPGLLRYRLGRACSRFVADVGIDDDQEGRGSAQFEVWADGERLFESGVMTGGTPARAVNVDVTGRRELRLFIGIGGDTNAFDHGVWAGARLECDTTPAAH